MTEKFEDISEIWRLFRIQVWSPPMESWLELNRFVQVRPGESADAVRLQVAKEEGYKELKSRLLCIE